tara:strand:+ start:1187 stop:1588 length:402 start_codon:yes stop_codon:yes gene_type:complete
MADAVNSQTLFDGESQAVMKFNNVSDGTGETAVLKVDVSALTANFEGKACTAVNIRRITASVNGMSVNVLWDASTDVSAFILSPGMYTLDFTGTAILGNNAGSGKTGDIVFTTVGAASGDTYSVILDMIKTYA